MRLLSSSLLVGVCAVAISAPVAAQSIRPGQSVSGSLQSGDAALDDGSYFDCYRLEGAGGRPVTVTMESGDFDAYLAVIEGSECKSGESVETDDDGAGGTNARIDFTPGNGRYAIRANSLAEEEVGSYRLSVVWGPPPAAATTGVTSINLPEYVEGTLADGDREAGDDTLYDCYAFDARAGQTLEIGMGSEDFDAYISLHRGGTCDDEIATNDDGFEEDSTDSYLEHSVARTGRYSVRANSLMSGEEGAYELIVSVK